MVVPLRRNTKTFTVKSAAILIVIFLAASSFYGSTILHSSITDLRKEMTDSKTTLSALTSNMQDVQSQLSDVQSQLSDVQSQLSAVSSLVQQSEKAEIAQRLIQSVIKTSEGKGWKVANDFKNGGAISNPHNFECEIVDYKPSGRQTGHKICVHPFNDIVSNEVRGNGDWQDCRGLSIAWNKEVNQTDENAVYVEIGANIGTCVMEMLHNTNAPIIAFEPNPKNLYPMKKSLSMLPKSYQDRVAIFPIALGSSKSISKIYSASNNMGNSVVGKPVKDESSQEFHPEDVFEIYLERLDSILNADSEVTIPLMKMDAQGFECEILDGMGEELAASVYHIHFEKAEHWQNAHGCNDFLAKFRHLGYTIYNSSGGVVGPEMDNQKFGVIDLDAKKARPSH